ncbi:MAG: hypothetical protein QW566_01980, partial [Candidatus Jordarchaeales archaeon]
QKEEALQPLGDDFFERATRYLRQLESAEEKAPELIRVERRRVNYMLTDLTELRLEKIILKTMANAPLDEGALSQEEKSVYDALKKLLTMKENRLEEIEEGDFLVVRVLIDLPEIVGVDLQTYGPFKAEDVATLPRENAVALIKRGVAAPIITGK